MVVKEANSKALEVILEDRESLSIPIMENLCMSRMSITLIMAIHLLILLT